MGLDGVPEARTFDAERPTRTVAIWCCTCALLTMLLRLFGKLVRINKWEGDDKYMAASIAPLISWMALTCYVLKLGTNNVDYSGLSAEDIHNREMGSKLTLVSRFIYITFIWTQKVSIQSFYRRMISSFWEQWHKKALDWICVILAVTFVATCVALFVECVPIQQNWQVVPAPPVVCRQAIPFLVMEVAFSSMLDILLAIYTYPIILGSAMPWVRKSYLLGVFSLNLLPPMVSLAKIPALQFSNGSPQRRVLLAGIHILIQCSVANAVVLMSFTRGTGPKKKKRKYRAISDAENGLSASASMQQTTRPTPWSHYDISADNSGKNTPREITDRLAYRDSLSLSPDDTNVNAKHPASNLSLQISYDLPFKPLSPPTPVSPRSTVPPTSARRQSATNVPPSYISSFMPAPSMSVKPYAYNPEPFDERKVNFFDLGGLTEGSATDGKKRDSGEGPKGESDNGNLTPGRKDRRFSFRKYSS